MNMKITETSKVLKRLSVIYILLFYIHKRVSCVIWGIVNISYI